MKGRPGGRSGFAGGIKIRIRLRRDQRLQAVGGRPIGRLFVV